MNKRLDLSVYEVLDQGQEALAYLTQSLSRKKPADKIRFAIDTYSTCQKWLIEHGHLSAFIDLRMRAEQMVANRDLLKSVPYDEETWAYYLAHMPAYAAAMDSLISDNHELNAMVVQAVARDECKTDPYVTPSFCALLLKNRDWQAWQHYVADRRHNNASKIAAICSLHALHPEDLPPLLPFLTEFMADHPWRENCLFKDLANLRRQDISTLFIAAMETGYNEIADNLLLSYRFSETPLSYLALFAERRPQIFTDQWQTSWLSHENSNNGYRGITEGDSYSALAFAVFHGDQKPMTTEYLNICSSLTLLKLMAGVAELRRNQPELFALISQDAVNTTIEQYLSDGKLTRDDVGIILTETHGIEEDFYVNANAYKRMSLSEDLGL